MVWINIIYYLALSFLLTSASPANKTLKSIYVIFRHGDRTPDKYPSESYPTDPYKDNPFYPIGFAGLTNQGKARLYQLGTSLRERYDNFLGDIYWPDDLKLLSTNTARTKMSLGIVLAALYPPKGVQVWKEGFNWQPIPIVYFADKDNLHFAVWECPLYMGEVRKVRQTPEYKKELAKFTEFMKDLTVFTGREVKDTEFIYYLYLTLTVQSTMNLTLPEWTKPYFPKGLILDAALLEYDVMSFHPKLKRLNGGFTLRKIFDDISIVVNKSISENPKIHLYSAHESTISAILQTLNLWKRVTPKYTSSIIFELYEINSEYFIHLVYYKGIPSEYEVLLLPGCSEYCSLKKFIEITKNSIPVDIEKECYGTDA